MSDCTDGGRQVPEKPTIRRLCSEWGQPPWTYSVPWPECLPPEAAELIGAVELGDVRFVREGAAE